MKKMIIELEPQLTEKDQKERFENISFELHKQEDLFQDLVLEYNKICKTNKIFVNSSLASDKQFESGLRISLKQNSLGR